MAFGLRRAKVFPRFPTYVVMIHTNVTDRQADRQTDDMQSQYRALHYGASRGKNDSNLSPLWDYYPCLPVCGLGVCAGGRVHVDVVRRTRRTNYSRYDHRHCWPLGGNSHHQRRPSRTNRTRQHVLLL